MSGRKTAFFRPVVHLRTGIPEREVLGGSDYCLAPSLLVVCTRYRQLITFAGDDLILEPLETVRLLSQHNLGQKEVAPDTSYRDRINSEKLLEPLKQADLVLEAGIQRSPFQNKVKFPEELSFLALSRSQKYLAIALGPGAGKVQIFKVKTLLDCCGKDSPSCLYETGDGEGLRLMAWSKADIQSESLLLIRGQAARVVTVGSNSVPPETVDFNCGVVHAADWRPDSMDFALTSGKKVVVRGHTTTGDLDWSSAGDDLTLQLSWNGESPPIVVDIEDAKIVYLNWFESNSIFAGVSSPAAVFATVLVRASTLEAFSAAKYINLCDTNSEGTKTYGDFIEDIDENLEDFYANDKVQFAGVYNKKQRLMVLTSNVTKSSFLLIQVQEGAFGLVTETYGHAPYGKGGVLEKGERPLALAVTHTAVIDVDYDPSDVHDPAERNKKYPPAPFCLMMTTKGGIKVSAIIDKDHSDAIEPFESNVEEDEDEDESEGEGEAKGNGENVLPEVANPGGHGIDRDILKLEKLAEQIATKLPSRKSNEEDALRNLMEKTKKSNQDVKAYRARLSDSEKSWRGYTSEIEMIEREGLEKLDSAEFSSLDRETDKNRDSLESKMSSLAEALNSAKLRRRLHPSSSNYLVKQSAQEAEKLAHGLLRRAEELMVQNKDEPARLDAPPLARTNKVRRALWIELAKQTEKKVLAAKEEARVRAAYAETAADSDDENCLEYNAQKTAAKKAEAKRTTTEKSAAKVAGGAGGGPGNRVTTPSTATSVTQSNLTGKQQSTTPLVGFSAAAPPALSQATLNSWGFSAASPGGAAQPAAISLSVNKPSSSGSIAEPAAPSTAVGFSAAAPAVKSFGFTGASPAPVLAPAQATAATQPAAISLSVNKPSSSGSIALSTNSMGGIDLFALGLSIPGLSTAATVPKLGSNNQFGSNSSNTLRSFSSPASAPKPTGPTPSSSQPVSPSPFENRTLSQPIQPTFKPPISQPLAGSFGGSPASQWGSGTKTVFGGFGQTTGLQPAASSPAVSSTPRASLFGNSAVPSTVQALTGPPIFTAPATNALSQVAASGSPGWGNRLGSSSAAASFTAGGTPRETRPDEDDDA